MRHAFTWTIALVVLLTGVTAQAWPKCFVYWQHPVAVSENGRYLVETRDDFLSTGCGLWDVIDTQTGTSAVEVSPKYSLKQKMKEDCGSDWESVCMDLQNECGLEVLSKVLTKETSVKNQKFVALSDVEHYGPFDLNGSGVLPSNVKGGPPFPPHSPNRTVVLKGDSFHVSAEVPTRKAKPVVLKFDAKTKKWMKKAKGGIVGNLYVAPDFYLMTVTRVRTDGDCEEVVEATVHAQKW